MEKVQNFYVRSKVYSVDPYYQMNEVPIGSGAYGDVCGAVDTRYNRKVAIKKITDAFHDLVDAKRILREVKMLRHFDSPHVVRMLDTIPCINGRKGFNDVYMVLERMDTDMHKIIRERRPLSEKHIQWLSYQALCGLKYIHSVGVIHRDIKPSNLLVNLKDCSLKICDFGLSRPLALETDMTEYVVTRWYRPPEVMLGNPRCDTKVDVWSLGCVIAEMITKTPLFRGKNYIEQLQLIFGLLGTPTRAADVEWIRFQKAHDFVSHFQYRKAQPFRTKFAGVSSLAVDLLEKLVVFNPNSRHSVDEALAHPFFAAVRHVSHEKISAIPFDSAYETKVGTEKAIKDEMYKEIIECRAQAINGFQTHCKKHKSDKT